ncbi:hypothetical protein P8452_26922 [Trifolium repens]|nr:hypothetical protein P8452_26922 [Trifolium repens]
MISEAQVIRGRFVSGAISEPYVIRCDIRITRYQARYQNHMVSGAISEAVVIRRYTRSSFPEALSEPVSQEYKLSDASKKFLRTRFRGKQEPNLNKQT